MERWSIRIRCIILVHNNPLAIAAVTCTSIPFTPPSNILPTPSKFTEDGNADDDNDVDDDDIPKLNSR